MEETTPKCFLVLIRQIEKRRNQLQEKKRARKKQKISGKRRRNEIKALIKAVIDLFGILINQDFFISQVNVNIKRNRY